MKNRVDEVFSVERLRKAWKGDGVQGPPPVQIEHREPEGGEPVATGSPQVLFDRLREAISRHFPASRAAVLEPLLHELGQQIEVRFPPSTAPPLSEEERAAVDTLLEDLLNQIEDLVDAMDLSSRQGGSS